MPQTTECLLDMALGSALTLWRPSPNSLLSCVDYPSFPCDLGKNTERDSHIAFEITMTIKVTLKLNGEVKWRWGEGYWLYLLSASKKSSGMK